MSTSQEATPIDNRFDTLMAMAKKAESDEQRVEYFKSLWASFLELETWVFLTTGGADLPNASPFIGFFDGQPWALAFTDPQKATEFAGPDLRFRDSNGDMLFIGIPRLQAIQWVLGLQQHGVVGIRINQGEFGWYAPLANLPAIVLDLAGDA